jgi:hypothetical protein
VFNKPLIKLGESRKHDLGRALKANINKFASESLPRYSSSEVTDVVQHFYTQPSSDQENLVLKQFKLAYGIAKTEDNKVLLQSLGSILISAGMSHNDFQKWTGTNFAKNEFKRLKFCSETLGPGKVPAIFDCYRNLSKKVHIVEQFVTYLLTDGIKTASCKPIKNSAGENINIPVIYRRTTPHHFIEGFRRDQMLRRGLSFNRRSLSSEKIFVALTNATMVDIVSVVCGQKLVSLAALDTCSELHGRQNFIMIVQF